MGWLLAVGIGTLAGFHSASWGMYKDAPHEGFTWRTFLRSPLLTGLVVAPLCYPLAGLRLTRPSGIVLFFGLVYIVERALIEFYKTFLRDEDQSKYAIPMQFHIGGRVVKDNLKRRLIGVAYVAAVLLVVGVVWWLHLERPGLPPLLAVLLVGPVGGWISAIGGAWKDGPIEGFSLPKFFRSPLVALFWALVLAHFTRDYILLVAGATGYTVATTETYKTFFFPDEPRGKFAGTPVHHPDMLRKRNRVIPLYAAIWLAVLGALLAAFLRPHAGLLSLL